MAYNLNSTLGEVLSNPELKAELENLIPAIKTHPYLSMAKNFSLNQCASMASGIITPDILEKVKHLLEKY